MVEGGKGADDPWGGKGEYTTDTVSWRALFRQAKSEAAEQKQHRKVLAKNQHRNAEGVGGVRGGHGEKDVWSSQKNG